MLVKAAVLAASMFMAGHAVAADSTSTGRDPAGAEAKTIRFDPHAIIVRGQPARIGTQILFAPYGFDSSSDLETGRGPSQHARALTNIAVAASVGNRDAVEIASNELRNFGVTREDIDDAIERTKLHGGPLGASPGSQFGHDEMNANSVWVVSY